MKHGNFIVRTDTSIEFPQLDGFKAFKSVLVQVFAATSNLDVLGDALSNISTQLPDSNIIGISTDGTINQGILQKYKNVIQISVSGFDKSEIKLAVSENNADSFQTGIDIANNTCTKGTKVLIAFSEA